MRVSNLLFLRARTGTTQQEHVQYSSTLSARLIRVGTSRLLHRPARGEPRGAIDIDRAAAAVQRLRSRKELLYVNRTTKSKRKQRRLDFVNTYYYVLSSPGRCRRLRRLLCSTFRCTGEIR